MKKEHIAVLIGALIILCICVVLAGIVIYLWLGQQTDVTGPQATATIAPLPATPASEPTPVPPPPTIAPDAPLSAAPAHSVVDASQMPASHKIAFDSAGILHLVWGDTETGFYHQPMTPDGIWQGAKPLTADFQTVFGLVDLLPDLAGQICVFINAATDSNVASTLGLYMRCLVQGQWSPAEGPLVGGDWDHPPAFAPDGAVRVAQLNGPGRAPVQLDDVNLSPDEGFVYHPQLTIDADGNYHALWERRAGDAYTTEYRYSGDGGQTWSEIQSLADMPGQSSLLSLAADEQGNVHVVAWAGTDGVFYKRWMPVDGWEPASEVTGDLTGGTWGDLAVGPNGLAHIVWGNEFADVKHYVRQRADGAWSQPRLITDQPVTEVHIAIDPFGGRHFVWRGPDNGLYYLALPPVTLAELGRIEGKVVVTTDKAEYTPGEPVKISLTNHLDAPIWYAQELDCGLSFWQLETCEPNRIIQYAVPCVWAEPKHKFTPLNPGETVTDEWIGVLQTLGDSGVVEQLPEPNCYRIRVPFALGAPRGRWGADRYEVVSGDFHIK